MALHKERYCHTLGCRMGYAVKAIMRKLTNRFLQQEIDLTLEQYFILNILDNEQGLILRDLAEIVDRDKSAVLRHIDCLEENHFVTRATDPEDRRRKLLIVTKPGVKELTKAREMDEQVNQEIIACIDDEKVQVLEEMVHRIFKYAAQ
ncbi:MAG TPA: MarR family transcriptional regulator [Balneolaceae bacterium]|nr:MarR family transcriptional regulator [Balneolaceae bacterium]